ncbi:hypothetical protein ROJ8625_03853 [Roseivivax jejudonensis]|uniref:Polyphosphate kinase n=1 Tax=Roseivivax jejudonensis TaxID=1529041 RepID=A0A1X7A7P2_9RHOB|nr:DUF1007 family protein [Roseivivax jejudonensis]SLN72585.1 hypothetical protein ROJ8625_03853 [Roseivivax jejudonensis]
MLRTAIIAGLAALPTTLGAHPHVFVDTVLNVVVDDQGRITQTEMTWSYDELFTLLILEDEGLDSDADGQLTDAERKELLGFDFEVWPEGFEGDLYLEAQGEKVELGHPVSTEIDVIEGRIVATHTRTVPDVPAEGAVFRQYDPTYYVAYTLDEVTVSGECSADVAAPDPDAGEEALAQALTEASEDQFEVLELGVHYADTIMVTCAPSS